jgi:hypothetical protein
MNDPSTKDDSTPAAPPPVPHIVYGRAELTGRGYMTCVAQVLAASVAAGVADRGQGGRPGDEQAILFGMGVPELAAAIRRANRLEGPTIGFGWRLAFLGECHRPKWEPADVYLFFGGEDEEATFVSTCRKVYAGASRRVVMLVASRVRLSVEHLLLLKGLGLSAIRLTTRVAEEGWALPWDQLLLKKTAAGVPRAEEEHPAAYCRVITQEGTSTANREQYVEFVAHREDYDMFIDGVTGEVFLRLGKAETRKARLTARERGILIDFVGARRPMTPRETETGRRCASERAARVLFETARAKADKRLKRYEYRAFCLHRSPASPELNRFEFAPPKNLAYCVIVPV